MALSKTAVCMMTWFAMHGCAAQHDGSVPKYKVVGVEMNLPLVTATLAPEAASITACTNADSNGTCAEEGITAHFLVDGLRELCPQALTSNKQVNEGPE